MSSSSRIRDLHWALQAIRVGGMDIHNISFYHTQESSSSYQETDNSMIINISTNNKDNSQPDLCQLLTALARDRRGSKTPVSMVFHNIGWEQKQLQSLGSLLDENTNIKLLEFRRNFFGVARLREFSDMIGRNRGIRALVFSECQLEFHGASFLASALSINETLEELQVWEDSIGSRGAEELSRMIEVNATLKSLIVLDKDSITASPLISAVLARNRAMEVHIWSRENDDRSSKAVEFTPESSTLRIYKLDPWGTQRAACALGWNTTVRTLDMTGVRLKSKWAKEFRGVLERNRTLRDAVLSRTCLRDKAVVHIAAGLFKNRSLESLRLDGNWFGGVGVEHLLCPMSRFSALQDQANATLKSITFGGGKTKMGRSGVLAILRLLETNQSIVQLGICDDISMRPDDVAKIFRSLERNATLRHLSLRCCKGVDGELVLQAIMETLQVNPWLEEIDLSGTPLHAAGKADKIYDKLGQNGSLVDPEKDTLHDLPLTMPTCCRVFFCGQESAGKTTLCNSISYNLNSTNLPYIDQLRTLVNPVELIARTSEIKIKTIQDGDIKISIWNLVGQHENYALHDLMFPSHGSPSFFLIISSLFQKPANREPKRPEEIEDDLLYWLRFIASNSKRAKTQPMLPHVTIVLTHYDKVSQGSEDLHLIVNSIQILRDRFHGFVEFYPTIFTVDARSSISVSKLTHHLRKTSKTILQRVPQVYQLCNDLIGILRDWRLQHYNKPAIRWNEFCELCQLRVPALRIRSRRDNMEKLDMRRRAVAHSLHHVGEVIFFEALGFLILDTEWFCEEVLGQLVKLDSGKMTGKKGFMSKKELEKTLRARLQNRIPGMGSKIFDNLEASDLIRMMLKLELCYEQDPGDPQTLLLIPSMLEEGGGTTQKWQLSNPDCIYVGRRLECDDSRHMFLTSGFFPRLQVHLHNKLFKSRNQQGAGYSLEKNLISITINGVHVRVEVGGHLGYYIDVLACSTRSVTEILRLLGQLIIPTIHSLCPSITLRENVIRPDCVKYLVPPRFRRTQAISVQRLKEAMLSMPAESMYDYQHTWSSVDNGTVRPILGSGFSYARELLSDEDFREVLGRRYYDLHHLATALAVPLDETEDSAAAGGDNNEGTIEPSLSGIAKGVELVLQRLRIIEQEIKDVKQEIQGLRYYEHRILIELHRKVEYMVNYNVQLGERRVPRMFYFVQVQNYSKRLVTRIFSGMTALRLHMLCEFRREMHAVDEQRGCEVMQVENEAVKCLLPYMSMFMKLLTFALKIGAHIAAGMGEMIPDLSKEVAHLIDSSLIHGGGGGAAAAMAAGGAVVGVGVAAFGRVGGNRNRSSRSTASSSYGGGARSAGIDVAQDMRAAQQWLVDFLKGQRITTGKDIAERFGLWRVRYLDDGQIAWICQRHKGMRAAELIEIPL